MNVHMFTIAPWLSSHFGYSWFFYDLELNCSYFASANQAIRNTDTYTMIEVLLQMIVICFCDLPVGYMALTTKGKKHDKCVLR